MAPPRSVRNLLTLFDLLATGVFALEGALAGVVAGLDVFGVLVVGVVTATGGGIMRDVLIGDVPPAAFRIPRDLVVAIAGGIVAIALGRVVDEIPEWLLVGLDAAGLGLFAASGAEKSLQFGLSAMPASFMGTLTAVGGGTLRDLLLGEVPAILRVHVYAVAALAGAVVVVMGVRRAPVRWAMAAGVTVTFVLRVIAATFDWNLPVPGR